MSEVENVAYTDLSVDELKRQLEELQQSQADLQRALEVRRQEGKHEVAQEVKDIVQGRGYELSEILPLLQTRRRRAAVARATNRPYTQYVDPENPKNVYVRGVLPGWMKQKMQEQGYDPSQKEDRDAFKASYLRAVEG